MNIEDLEKQELQKKQWRVASLFLLALVLAMIFAYWMGAFSWGPTRTFFLDYEFAGGVEKGTPVRLAGIKVGRVSDIQFTAEQVRPLVRLKIEMDRNAFAQLSDASKFYINLAGIIGERYVEVVTKKGNKVESSHVFRGEDPPRVDQLISQSYGIFGDIRDFFNDNKKDFKDLAGDFNNLIKNLEHLFQVATPDQKKQFNKLLSNVVEMSGDLRITVAGLRKSIQHLESPEGQETLEHLSHLLKKGDHISVNDIRKILLEDGVKINFSKTKVEEVEEIKKLHD